MNPAGTFTEQAAVRHFGGAAHTVAAASLEEVLRGWLPSRRWFPFDGDPEQLSL